MSETDTNPTCAINADVQSVTITGCTINHLVSKPSIKLFPFC